MNFKKKSILITSAIFVFCVVLIFLYKNNMDNADILIPKPQKIIIYNSNKSKIIDENNKSFNKILRLTSERLKSIEGVKKSMDSYERELLLKEINTDKYSWRCIEFIYDNPTSFKLKLNNNQEEQLKIKKSFFLISAEADLDFGTDMIYGEDEYTNRLKNINTNNKIMTRLLKIIEQDIS